MSRIKRLRESFSFGISHALLGFKLYIAKPLCSIQSTKEQMYVSKNYLSGQYDFSCQHVSVMKEKEERVELGLLTRLLFPY